MNADKRGSEFYIFLIRVHPRASASILLLFLTLSVSAADLTTVLAGMQKRYGSANTITAEFTQSYRAPGIDQVESGTLWIKKPGLMHWQYRSPESKLFIADGSNTYLYVPADRQVTVSPFSTAELHSTPLRFLLGQGDVGDSFTLSESQSKIPGTCSVRLVPRKPDSDYAFLVLEIDEKTYDLRRILVREEGGNTSEFVFSNVRTNVPVDKKLFEFKIPKGVDVVRLEQK